MLKKKILVCCGTGIATSVQVANKLQRMLKERDIEATMKECKTGELLEHAESFEPDAIVSSRLLPRTSRCIAELPFSPASVMTTWPTRSLPTSRPDLSA